MGILDPRRAVPEGPTSNTRDPFNIVDNEHRFLDRADLVTRRIVALNGIILVRLCLELGLI